MMRNWEKIGHERQWKIRFCRNCKRQEANVDGVHIGWNEESGLAGEREITKNLPESLKEDAAKEYGLETEAITLVP